MNNKLTKKELRMVVLIGVLALIGSIDRFDSYEMPEDKELVAMGIMG
jgi:MFS superfamily sulfate permease-like transporter